jgi:hypothetical protein
LHRHMHYTLRTLRGNGGWLRSRRFESQTRF